MKKILVAALLVLLAWHYWPARSVQPAPGVLALDVPQQLLLRDAANFELNGYRITPLADFTLQARVLSREDYHVGREADLAPLDIAFGWGRMSDSAILEHIDISQGGRWYRWRTRQAPIPLREIELSSANMHLIPADKYVADQLDDVRRGQVLQLSGKLVRVDASDGWHWQSSLTREDTGHGSCELVYVEHVIVQ